MQLFEGEHIIPNTQAGGFLFLTSNTTISAEVVIVNCIYYSIFSTATKDGVVVERKTDGTNIDIVVPTGGFVFALFLYLNV